MSAFIVDKAHVDNGAAVCEECGCPADEFDRVTSDHPGRCQMCADWVVTWEDNQ